MIDESVLDSALAYHVLGWSIIPIKAGTKKPGCRKWINFQTERPSELQLRKWFARDGERGMAVILGDVSGGLVCRDFDTMPSYQHWASEHRDLARSLPTVITSRGRHVYFRSPHRGIRNCGNGELRGAGYCVLPPSRHPTGSLYQWVTPPPAEPLPEVDVAAAGLLPERYVTESTEKTERTEEYRCHREVEVVSGRQGLLAPSCTPLETGFDELPTVVQSAIIGSLPTGPGRRNEQVFELARALKAVPFLSDAAGKELRPHVLHWHSLAQPVIRTQPFEETWIDFLRGWKNVKFPKGAEPMVQIAERALILEPPPVAARYEQPALRKLVSLCRELQQTAGEGPFYLACRTAGRLLAVDHMTASRWLFLLVSDGILIEVQKGGPRTGKASRYRYTGLASG